MIVCSAFEAVGDVDTEALAAAEAETECDTAVVDPILEPDNGRGGNAGALAAFEPDEVGLGGMAGAGVLFDADASAVASPKSPLSDLVNIMLSHVEGLSDEDCLSIDRLSD